MNSGATPALHHKPDPIAMAMQGEVKANTASSSGAPQEPTPAPAERAPQTQGEHIATKIPESAEASEGSEGEAEAKEKIEADMDEPKMKLSEMMKEMQKTIVQLMQEVKEVKMDNAKVTKQFENMEKENEKLKNEKWNSSFIGDDDGRASDIAKKRHIKGYDSKSSEKPEKYDMDPAGFIGWVKLFRARMSDLDHRWKNILKSIEAKQKSKMTRADIDEIDEEYHDMDSESIKEALYLNLLQYTKGTAHALTISNDEGLVYETYRYIIAKGKNNNTVSLIRKRNKANNPDHAKDVSEVEKKNSDWKANIRELREMGDDEFEKRSDSSKVTTLIGMMPIAVADHVISKHNILDEKSGLFDEVEDTIAAYLSQLEIRDDSRKQGPPL